LIWLARGRLRLVLDNTDIELVDEVHLVLDEDLDVFDGEELDDLLEVRLDDLDLAGLGVVREVLRVASVCSQVVSILREKTKDKLTGKVQDEAGNASIVQLLLNDIDDKGDLPASVLVGLSALPVVRLEEGDLLNVEGDNNLVLAKSANLGASKLDVEVEVGGTVDEPLGAHLGKAHFELVLAIVALVVAVVGGTGDGHPLLAHELVELVDIDAINDLVEAELFDVLDGGVARVVDGRSVLVVVEIGEVEEDVVTCAAEELEVGGHVILNGLFVCGGLAGLHGNDPGGSEIEDHELDHVVGLVADLFVTAPDRRAREVHTEGDSEAFELLVVAAVMIGSQSANGEKKRVQRVEKKTRTIRHERRRPWP
jgi:hypothetical protein